MVTHSDIMVRAGPTDMARGQRLGVEFHQARDWRVRNRIPQEHWSRIAKAGIASLEELAEAAAERAA